MTKKTAIVGIGQTELSRGPKRSRSRTSLEAIGAALADAGLQPAEIDGLVRFDLEGPTKAEIAKNFGIENLRYSHDVGDRTGAACAAVFHASMAIEAGAAKVIVCWRAGGPTPVDARMAASPPELHEPFGLLRPVDSAAMIARRYLHETGASVEALGAVAVACRKHAIENPRALETTPLAMTDYLAGDVVSEPLCRFDCAVEADGSLALVVTSVERARDCRQEPAFLLGGAQGAEPHGFVTGNGSPSLETAPARCAQSLYETADVEPADVDVAEIDDAFTPWVLLALEEYGFCEHGEAADFVSGGQLEWPEGGLPVNTSGGGLSEAYVDGFNLILEGVRQVRGSSSCQIAGAEVVLVTSGSTGQASALLLSSQ